MAKKRIRYGSHDRKLAAYRRDHIDRGDFSACFRCFRSIRRHDSVTLCLRVSRRQQRHRDNLTAQEQPMLAALSERGADVVEVLRHVGSGWNPSWLRLAALRARKRGGKLVFATTDRAIRHRAYHSSQNPDAQATEADLDRLRFWTLGVPLVTFLDPEASPGECRALLTRWGQALKGKGGRPRKQRRGEYQPGVETCANLSKVFWMKLTGQSLDEIADLLDEPRGTIRGRWRRIRTRGYSWPDEI